MERVTKMSTKCVLEPASQSIFWVEWCTEVKTPEIMMTMKKAMRPILKKICNQKGK
jgi:hypothetical protein